MGFEEFPMDDTLNYNDVLRWIYADGKEYHQEFAITQWQDIKHPVIEAITTTDGTITIGVKVQCNAGAWGNLDEFLLAPVE